MQVGYNQGPFASEVPIGAWLQNPELGLYQIEHFDEPFGSVKYTKTETTGTGALETIVPGGIFTITTTTSDDQGAQIQAVASPFLPVAGRPIYMEGRFKFSLGIWSTFFFGLATSDSTIIGTGSISTTECIGWYMDATSHLAANGYLQFRVDDTTTVDTLTATDFLIPAAVWFRLGFKIDYTALKATIYMTNESTGVTRMKEVAIAATTAIPNAAIVVSLAGSAESQGATPVATTINCDYIRTAQPLV